MPDKRTAFANFLYRIAGSATIDARTFGHVAADQTATPQALEALEIGSRLLALAVVIVFGLASPMLAEQAIPADHKLASVASIDDGAELFRNH